MNEENQGADRQPSGIENRRISERARQRAHRVLAARHHAEFRAIWDAERRAAGYVDLPRGRPKRSVDA